MYIYPDGFDRLCLELSNAKGVNSLQVNSEESDLTVAVKFHIHKIRVFI